MKVLGFLLLLSGWTLVLAALALLPNAPNPRVGFVIAGLAVEAAGLVLVTRAHLPEKETQR